MFACLHYDTEDIMASCEFQDQLTQFLPKMRVWALGLTRNAAAADDLVQDAALKTLVANETFIPGTNFSAWVHRIMINHFISTVRRARETTDIEQVPEIAVPASQQDSTDLREVSRAFRRLPEDQKRAFRSIVIDEKSYQQISEESGLAVGTLKSRVYRARLQLRAEMIGEARMAA
jgi:RNA polymerase sigma-70 factor, ECF subfamily